MWNYIHGALKTLISDVTGAPLALRELLAKGAHHAVQLVEPAPTIAEGQIVRWHAWGNQGAFDWPPLAPGEMRGWGKRRDGYVGLTMRVPELAVLGAVHVQPAHTLDLRKIEGFSASKAALHEYRTVEEFAERSCPDWIADASHAQLRALLSHGEIRVLNAQHHNDHFSQYGWDGRVFLSNAGGSHHAAAAQYVARRLGADVLLQGPLHVYTLNEAAVRALTGCYEIFTVPEEASFQCAFHDALEAAGATYFWRHMPAPYRDQRAIFLPGDNPRAMAVAKEMRSARVGDLGLHLLALVQRQRELGLNRTLRVRPGHGIDDGGAA